jgi:hypothetical protein
MRLSLLIIFIFTTITITQAQILPPPPPSENPTPPINTTGVPIDGGTLALLIASGAYGYRRMKSQESRAKRVNVNEIQESIPILSTHI